MPDHPCHQCLEAQPPGWPSSLREQDIAQAKAVLDAAALVYAAEEHGPLLPVAFNRARDGVIHQVCINLHPELDWRVIDLSATFVGRLDGADDLRPSAIACARDYARQCQLFHAGLRKDPPILHPASMRVRWQGSSRDRKTTDC